MATTSLRTTVLNLRRWAETPAGAGDDELLRRFALSRDEAAFAELVRRHGTLVLGVARRVLGEHHAAEDVLQASFLLLARKAWRVRWRRSVAPWLHAAAYRLACEARRRRARQPMTMSEPVEVAGDAAPERPLLWQEVRCAVDEELAKLSAPVRAPLVLCYLQGLTRDEAALRLGWRLATLKRRLERGRNLLRVRLTQRGLALTAATGLLTADGLLAAESVREVVRIAAGGPVPASVAALLGDPGRWRRGAGALLLLIAGFGGVALAMKPGEPADPPPAAKPANAERVDVLGDPLPAGAVARLGSRLLTPGELVHSMAFSPDGKRLAIWVMPWGGSNPNRLIIADAATGRELRNTTLNCKLVYMTWLADGRGLALVKLTKKEFYLWEFTDEKNELPQRDKFDDTIFNDDAQSVAISPDGRWLALDRRRFDASARAIELRQVVPNTPLDKLPKAGDLQAGSGYVTTMFSGDSRWLFVLRRERKPNLPPVMSNGAGGIQDLLVGARVTVFEVATRNAVSSFDVWGPLIETVAVDPPRMALSPDGKTLYVGADTGHVHAYDWASGRETTSFQPHAPADPKNFEWSGIRSLALSPDGRTLYSVGPSYALTAVNPTADKPDARSFGRAGRVEQVVVSPDGRRVAAAGGTMNSRVTLLDTKTGEDKLARPGHGSMISSVAVRADGTVVTASHDQTVCWWDAERGRESRRSHFEIDASGFAHVALSADGRGLFAAVRGDVYFIDLESGLKSKITETPVKPMAALLGVSGSTVFHTAEEGKARQWDAATGRARRTFAATGRASMSPDGKHVVMLGSKWTRSGQEGHYNSSHIVFHDGLTGEQTRRWQTTEARFESAAWSADGRHVLVAGMSMRGRPVQGLEDALPIPATGLLLFDARTGEPLRSFEPASRNEFGPHVVTAVTFSPDGSFFAIGQIEGSVHVYELATGQVCRSFRGHTNQVPQLVFAANGRRLVSVSHDMTGLVWDSSFANLAKPTELETEAQRDRAWGYLTVPEWELAGPGIAALARRPEELVSLVRTRMNPATGPTVDAEAVAKLTAQLDDEIFAVRERAGAALSRLSRETLPLLQEHLATAQSAEARKRLRQAMRDVAAAAVPSERLRELRIVAMLEQADTEGARVELKRLASGHADAALTRDAAAALRRTK